MNYIEIIEYEDKYYQKYKDLSYEWLLKYNLLEREDEIILNNPKKEILDKGGKIFLAKHKYEIVGTSSIIKIDKDNYELAKLGVTERFQNLGIAKRLIEKCIISAKEASAKNIILYTNHKLKAASKLYKMFGFVKVDITNNKYIEADTKMKIIL